MEVEDGQRDLHCHVEGENYDDAGLCPIVCLFTSFKALVMKLVDTAALAQTVVDLSNFVKKSTFHLLTQLLLLLLVKLRVFLIDRVTLALAILHELVGGGFILAVFHHTLYISESDTSEILCFYLLARFMIRAM